MNNLGSLSFHNHLRLAHEFLPLMAGTCVPPFEHLAERKTNWFQESISKTLHGHYFFSIIFYFPFHWHWMHLKPYARSSVSAWLFVYLIIFFSNWFQTFFFHYIVHSIGPPPSFNPCLITLHLWPTFEPSGDPYSLLCRWWGENNFPWCCVGCLCMYHEGCKISYFTWVDPYCALSYSLCVDMLTFWFQLMVFGCSLMSSSLTSFEYIWFHG
jgi:hypothetical protein